MDHQILDDLNRRMDKTVEVFEHELASVRTGRASVALLDSVRVDYYGQLMPLNQVATLKTPDASTITVQPWERNLLPAIDRAIRSADLDLNPASDGTMLRIPIPPLSQERRKQLAKSINRMAEEHKNALRQVRRDANQRAKKLVKSKELSEDLEHDLEAEVQKATDAHVKRIVPRSRPARRRASSRSEVAAPYSYLTHLECSKTGHRHDAFAPQNLSNEKHPLLARYDLEAAAETFTLASIKDRPFDLWRYHEVLPIQEERHCLKLGEGGTPLHPAPTLGAELGIRELLIKDEGMNPTGSFKDRGLCLAVSAAYQFDAPGIALPSAGNAGGAAAAYAARAGLQCVVAVPRDCPEVNRIEASVYGAEVHSIDGLISDAGRMIAELAPGRGLFEVATLKEPYRIEGKKTMGYEVFEQLGRLPDVILYPTGGGTGLIGMWKAFDEMEQLGWIGPERPADGVRAVRGLRPHSEGVRGRHGSLRDVAGRAHRCLRTPGSEGARGLPDPRRGARERRFRNRRQR